MSNGDDEKASIARLAEEARERAGPQMARDLRVALAALKRETDRADVATSYCVDVATAYRVSLGKIHDVLRDQLTRIELASQLSQRLLELAELATIGKPEK